MATVDPSLIDAGSQAVKAGRAESLSAMSEAVLTYEAEFGANSVQEMAAQERTDEKSVVVREPRRAGPRATRRRLRT